MEIETLTYEDRIKDPNGTIDESLGLYDYYDKQSCIKWLEDSVLNRIVTMFRTKGLPDSIPEKELFKITMRQGKGCVSEIRDTLVANKCTYIPPLDCYRHGTKLRVVNPWGLNIPGLEWMDGTTSCSFNKDFTIGKDCVKITNDPLEIGVLPIIWKYGVFLTELELSYLNFLITLRAPFALIADDVNAKKEADEWLQGLRDGNLASIMSSAISKNFDGVHTTQFSTMQAGALTQFIEGEQYTKAMLWNELGIDMNYNMKRERLSEGETDTNQSILRTLCDSMLEEYQRSFEEVNKMFGVNWEIEFDGQWARFNPNIATSGEGQMQEVNEDDAISTDKSESESVSGEYEQGDELGQADPETEETTEQTTDETDKQDNEENQSGDNLEDVSRETLADIDIEDVKEIVEDIKEIVEDITNAETEDKEDSIEYDAESEN